MMPNVIDPESPYGFPIATTGWPTSIPAEETICRGTNSDEGALVVTTAMSL